MGFQPQQGVEMDGEDVDDTEIEEDEDAVPSYKHSSMSVDIRGETLLNLADLRDEPALRRHESTSHHHFHPVYVNI